MTELINTFSTISVDAATDDRPFPCQTDAEVITALSDAVVPWRPL